MKLKEDPNAKGATLRFKGNYEMKMVDGQSQSVEKVKRALVQRQ
jgi:hypothetical protein